MRGRRGKRDFVKESFFLFGGGKVFGLKSGRREDHVRQRGAFLWAVIFLNSFFRPFWYGIKRRTCRSTTVFSCSILIMIFFNVIRRCETTAYNYDCFPTHTIDSPFFFFFFLTSWITALCSRFLPLPGCTEMTKVPLELLLSVRLSFFSSRDFAFVLGAFWTFS